MAEIPELITTTQVAERLGLTPITILRAVQAGVIKPAQRLPGIKGQWLFHPDEADRYAKLRADADEALRRLRTAP